MSRMKKAANRMEKSFQAGGAIPTPDPQLAEYNKALIEQTMRRLSQRTFNVSFTPTVWGGPSRDSKFAESEFTMGTAVGVRSWNVDRLGRLESPSYKTVWSPGEMTASCKANPFDFAAFSQHRVTKEEHQQASCSCGFYAYYEGFNDYAEPTRITGVIEGYGETQIGTRGFKSAKARIVALYVPDDSADLKRIGKTPFSMVRDNYGKHLPIFDDYSQMSAEFPTTRPEDAPSPDTDPDFWTRSI